jgi:iron complex transport system substrate-binding protein
MIRPGTVLTMLIACAVLAGCSSGPTPAPGVKAGPVVSDQSSAGFPLTLETEFGEVRIPEQPQRVVALGDGDADAAFALGVDPIAVVDWDQLGDPGVGPWVTKEHPADPELVLDRQPFEERDRIPFDRIADLEPDLILWTPPPLSEFPEPQRLYDRMATIAPTITRLTGKDKATGSFLDRQTRQVAKVLGKVEQGEQLLTDLDAKFADIKAEHPEFKDATLTMARVDVLTLEVPLEGTGDFAVFEQLGFDTPAGLQKMDENDMVPDNDYADVGLPYVDAGGIPDFDFRVLAADLVLIDAYQQSGYTDWIEKSPDLKKLRATKDGRTLMLPGNAYPPVSLALTTPSVISTSWALDILVPRLAEALA